MFHWLTKTITVDLHRYRLCCSVLTFFFWKTISHCSFGKATKWGDQELHSCFGNVICFCLTWERTKKQGKPLDTKHTTYHFQQKSTALFLQHGKLCWKWNEKLLVCQILYIEKWYTVWNIASQVKQQPSPPTLYCNSHQWNIIAGKREVKNRAVD